MTDTWPFRNQKVPVRKNPQLSLSPFFTYSLARQIVLCTFNQESNLREAQIFKILVNLSKLQNYSFSVKAITPQGKIQEGVNINFSVIFHNDKRSLCHHHHLTWGPWERSTWEPRVWVCCGSFCHLQGTVWRSIPTWQLSKGQTLLPNPAQPQSSP